ncbi:hypothetical protein ACHAPI_009357 [Fusarium lateritium]
MVDLPKTPDPFDETAYGSVKPPEKRKMPKKVLKKGEKPSAPPSPPPPPPPPAPPAEEDAWDPKPPMRAAAHGYDYYWPYEPEAVAEYDPPAKEPEPRSACDTPAADAEKEDAVEEKAGEYEAIVEAIPDKTDWDSIAPIEPEPPAEPSEDKAPPIYDRPWLEEEIPAKKADPTSLTTIWRLVMTETKFGYILQWRLYLFVAAKNNLTEHQARWSLDKETIDYRGTELHIEQVSQLIISEYRQAHSLLYDELLLGMGQDITPIEAWRLHDDLDLNDYGASWMTDERNSEILAGSRDILLRQIEGKAAPRRVFIRSDQNYHCHGGSSNNGGGGGEPRLRLCPQAMAIYEAHVQEFLKRMLTLIQVPAGPPLRSPELLSTTYANTGTRRRSVLMWEKMEFNLSHAVSVKQSH